LGTLSQPIRAWALRYDDAYVAAVGKLLGQSDQQFRLVLYTQGAGVQKYDLVS
jgi:hypothetical protein